MVKPDSKQEGRGKKVGSLILSASLCLTMLPVPALADAPQGDAADVAVLTAEAPQSEGVVITGSWTDGSNYTVSEDGFSATMTGAEESSFAFVPQVSGKLTFVVEVENGGWRAFFYPGGSTVAKNAAGERTTSTALESGKEYKLGLAERSSEVDCKLTIKSAYITEADGTVHKIKFGSDSGAETPSNVVTGTWKGTGLEAAEDGSSAKIWDAEFTFKAPESGKFTFDYARSEKYEGWDSLKSSNGSPDRSELAGTSANQYVMFSKGEEVYISFNATKDPNNYTISNVTFIGDSGATYKVSLAGEGTPYEIDISKQAVVSDIEDQTYTGSSIEPAVAVVVGDKTLVKGTDYTVAYADNTDPGKASITVTGIGAYKGSVTKNFYIVKDASAFGEIKGVWASDSKGYATSADGRSVRLTAGPATFNFDLPFRGTIEYTVEKVKGNYSTKLYFPDGTSRYTGVDGATYSSELAPGQYQFGSSKSNGDDYDITISNVTVTDAAGVKHQVLFDDPVSSGEITAPDVSDIPVQAWTGAALEPDVVVTVDGKRLTPGTDYTIEYKDNVAAGTAKVIVKGAGVFTGEVEKSFTIAKLAENTLLGAWDGSGHTIGEDGFSATITNDRFTFKAPESGKFTFDYARSEKYEGWDSLKSSNGSPDRSELAGTSANQYVMFSKGEEVYISFNATKDPNNYTISNVTFIGDSGTTYKVMFGWVESAQEPATHAIAYVLDGGVNAVSNPEIFTEGTAVELAAPTKEGYKFAGWYTDASFENKVTFIPETAKADITLYAKWVKEAAPAPTFPDVDYSESSWYGKAVTYVAERGLITGYTDGVKAGQFGVGDTLTRAQLATILWRNACPDEYASYDPETAVDATGISGSESGQYYTAAANWAVKNSVITGFDREDGTKDFAANENVSFEQLITILSRLCATDDELDAAGADLSAFADGSDASSWSAASLKWAADKGLVQGYDEPAGKYLRPGEDVARERVAVVLMRAFEMGILK